MDKIETEKELKNEPKKISLLKLNIIVVVLYFLSFTFLSSSCVECPIISYTFIAFEISFIILFLAFIIAIINLFQNLQNYKKHLLNILLQPFLLGFSIFLSIQTIDLANDVNLMWKYDAMFKFRRMAWDGEIKCNEDGICPVPEALVSKLGKYAAKNRSEYIFSKLSIGGYNAFILCDSYDIMYEYYHYFDTTYSNSVYIIDYNIKQ